MSWEGLPATLEETVPALDTMLGDEDRQYLQKCEDAHKAAISLHHSLGQHLRNEWGLWHGSPLAQHMVKVHGIRHPDDMSHEILLNFANAHIKNRFERIMGDD